jgi:PAS domain S-box-containing protein
VRVRLAARSRRNEALLRVIGEQSHEGIAITDMDLRFQFVNDRMVAIAGYTRDEMLHMSVHDVVAPGAEVVLRAVVEQGIAVTRESTLLRKDRAAVAVEVSGTRVEVDGERLLLAFVRDVRERVEAARRLRDSEERLRAVVESVPDFILMLAPDGTIRYINRIVPGISSADVIGRSVYDQLFVPPAFQERVRAALAAVVATGAPHEYEVEGLGPNGSTSWYSCRVVPVHSQGRISACVCVSTDVTANRATETALRQSEERFRKLMEAKPR